MILSHAEKGRRKEQERETKEVRDGRMDGKDFKTDSEGKRRATESKTERGSGEGGGIGFHVVRKKKTLTGGKKRHMKTRGGN